MAKQKDDDDNWLDDIADYLKKEEKEVNLD